MTLAAEPVQLTINGGFEPLAVDQTPPPAPAESESNCWVMHQRCLPGFDRDPLQLTIDGKLELLAVGPPDPPDQAESEGYIKIPGQDALPGVEYDTIQTGKPRRSMCEPQPAAT